MLRGEKMEIKIRDPFDDVAIIFSNNELNNYNFINMTIEGKEFTISFEDLEAIVNAYRVYFLAQKEQEHEKNK